MTTTDRPATEAPLTLDEAPPKQLSALDQGAFWGNIGVSLLGFSGAIAVLAPSGVPALSPVAAGTAAIVGTILGSLALALSTVPGAQLGAPAMVVLRGLLGTKLSYLPSVMNVLQMVGWGTFELVVIAQAAQTIAGGHGPRWLFVVIGGVVTTLLTLRPLGTVRLLRRYVAIAVAVSMVYFAIQIFRQPLPSLTEGSWQGFWVAADAALAVAVSFAPLSADYSRHSRSARSAFLGSFTAYSLTQSATYVLGIAMLLLVHSDPNKAFDPLLAVPLGVVFFAVLTLRELDQSFANVYSTAVSIQNLFPRADRRVLTVGIGVVTTLLALTFDISKYQNFLYLIGSVFVPLFAMVAADYFLGTGRSRWNVSGGARTRWLMLVPWVLGFSAYQLINPGDFPVWTPAWAALQEALHFTPQSWMSASVTSFLVAGLAAFLVGRMSRPAHQSV